MAEFRNLAEENEKLFEEVLLKTSIPEWIEFKVLVNDSQKEIYKINKTNDVVEKISKGVNFVIILNEEIFDQLEDDQKMLILNECLFGVNYNSERDSVSLDKPDFTTHSSILSTYGDESVIRTKESIKSLYDAKKQREDEEKAAQKENKKKKVA